MPDFSITLARWAAWAPGMESAEDWASRDFPPTGSEAKPALEWLPAMQRRRLPALARGVFQVAHQIVGDAADDLPTVLASSHGEPGRTLRLLENLADREPLSPAAFSLSVHNAISGQLGIALGNRAPASTVALAGDGLTGALIEALTLKPADGPVLVVIYEAPLPEPYRAYHRSDPFPWALALLLGNGDGPGFRLHDAPGSGDTEPQGPKLARFLARGGRELMLSGDRTDWHWQRLDTPGDPQSQSGERRP